MPKKSLYAKFGDGSLELALDDTNVGNLLWLAKREANSELAAILTSVRNVRTVELEQQQRDDDGRTDLVKEFQHIARKASQLADSAKLICHLIPAADLGQVDQLVNTEELRKALD